MHPATKNVLPTHESVDNCGVNVFEQIVRQINTKDGIRYKMHWCGYIATDDTTDQTKKYRGSSSRTREHVADVNGAQSTNVSETAET